MVFVVDPSRDVPQDLRLARLEKPKKLVDEDPEMASSPVTSHPTQRKVTLDKRMDVPKPAVLTVTDGQWFRSWRWTESDPYMLPFSQMARTHLPYPQEVSQVCLEQPCHCHRPNHAFCPACRLTRTCTLWCSGQSRRTATDQNIVHRQVCRGSIPHGTIHRPHSVSPSRNCFRNGPVLPAGCTTERFGP